MHAAIVAIGDEILAGRTQDTNSHYLATRLERLGIPVREIRVVSDQAGAIQGAIWELQERRRADVILTTGGLGPTHDDRTVHAVAALHGRDLVTDPTVWRTLEQRAQARYDQGKRKTPDPGPGATKTALVPRGAKTFTNPAGAAPGLALERRLRLREGTTWTLVLPGVPEEMRAIWLAGMERYIAGLKPAGGPAAPQTKRFVCNGPESDLAPHLAAIEADHEDLRVGSYPHWGSNQIGVTLTGPANVLPTAEKALTKRLATIGITLSSDAKRL